MAHYNKGANAERELLKIIYDNGFGCVRIAGSGATILPAPDIVALSPDKKLSFECKAWNSNYLNVSITQMTELIKWGEISGTEIFVAWKMPNKGWFFLKPEHFSKKAKSYTISKKDALKCSQNLNVILGKQAVLRD
jgi:Holliday junction resolvase